MTFNKIATAVAGALFALWANGAIADECPGGCYPKRWVYWGGNLMDPELRDGKTVFDQYKALLPRIKLAGFNGIALTPAGSGSVTSLLDPAFSDAYKQSLKTRLGEAVKAANDAGLEVIPVGGNPEMPAFLQPSLKEAFPVTTLYKVNAGRAAPIGDAVDKLAPANLLGDASFEQPGMKLWSYDPYVSTTLGGISLDSSTAHSGTNSLKFVPKLRNDPAYSKYDLVRLWQSVGLKQNTAYRLSFWLKSATFADPKSLRLLIQKPGTKATATAPATPDIPLYAHASQQGLGWGTTAGEWEKNGNTTKFASSLDDKWHEYNVQFNSGNQSTANIYLGMWNLASAAGAMWVDDMVLQEIGVSHPIQRDGVAPYVVQSANGSVTYPATAYTVDGEQLIIRDPSIVDGTVLKVGWRQSADHMFGNVAPSIACTNGAYFDWQDKYYDQVEAVFGNQPTKVVTGSPKKYFMYYDEIRVMNWESKVPGCGVRSAGDYLGGMVRGVQDKLPATVEYAIWNDMFDPNMNAIATYWQVNGNLQKPAATDYGLLDSTVIVNWTGGSDLVTTPVDLRNKSLTYFKDYPQVIATYYDNVASVTPWLNAVSQTREKVPALQIDGLMYTTWQNDYSKLEAFVDEVLKSDLGKHWPPVR